jgi:hypothetical protein
MFCFGHHINVYHDIDFPERLKIQRVTLLACFACYVLSLYTKHCHSAVPALCTKASAVTNC